MLGKWVEQAAWWCVLGYWELGLSGSLKQTGVTLGIPSPCCSQDAAGDVKSIKARE